MSNVKLRKFLTLEEGIAILQQQAEHQSLSLGKILKILSGKGLSLLLILLSLPFCQPFQIPGFSTPFGMAIAFIGLSMALGKHVWLPKKLLSKEISSEIIQKITTKALVWIKKIRCWLHPRLHWFCHSPFMEFMNGLCIALLGGILALPLPIPFSNLAAAWSIFLLSLGMLEDDGACILIGYVFFLLTLGFLVAMVFALKSIYS